MKFSVLIPLYNKADYVKKTINSVLSQTYQEFELIVVNDGSLDNGIDIVKQMFASLNPPLGGWEILSQENQGVAVSRNNGVKVAKYEYIAFLDADDSWEPTYLEEMKKLIESYPEAGIYGSAYYLLKKGHKRIAPIGIETDFDKGIINYCQVYAKTLCMPIWTGATIIKKSIFDSEKGFKPNLKLGEDFDLWIRVAMKYPVAFLNKPLSNYNQDVDLSGRAIGTKLYNPKEHMLFTDYGDLYRNPDFRYLYERLALYGLIPYYIAGKNKKKVDAIIASIDWKKQDFRYRLYYRILPKGILRLWMKSLKFGSTLKRMLTTLCKYNTN